MFNRLKNRVLTVVGPDIPALPSSGSIGGSSGGGGHHHHGGGSSSGRGDGSDHGSKGSLPEKFRYARPQFLQLLTYDELKASADHNVRPIIVPRDISLLPWSTGYAECVNSGKSEWNEDQAAFHRQVLSHPSKQYHDLPYTYFGIYDGHAGYGAALAASNQFHHILHEKLVDIIDLLMPRVESDDPVAIGPGVGLNAILPHPILFHKQVSKDELIVGALEAAFADMDAVLAEDRDKYRNAGGCTALVALFILGKLFVANAGDSRGVLCKRVHRKKAPNVRPPSFHEDGMNGDVSAVPPEEEEDDYLVYAEPCSFDHTPETERPRLLSVGKLNPNLMGGEYVAMEYAKKPMTKDLGTRILYRQGTMKGWTYKTLTRADLKMPIVTGEGKRSRLLGTIGVTRGFGDHDLKALGSGLPIKPFLSCHPDVVCFDLSAVETDPDADNVDGEYGVLVMATDGLWDVTYSQKVANTVFTTLKKFPTERHRYTMAAQELVAKSRGRANINGHWRLSDSRAAATVDDISVIVIPVYQYYLEYLEWKRSLQKPKPAPIATPLVVESVAPTEPSPAAEEPLSSSSEDDTPAPPVAEPSEDASLPK